MKYKRLHQQCVMLRTISLFTGIGGFELGLKPWINVCLMSDIDKYCQEILARQFPNVPLIPDVKSIVRSSVKGKVDFIIGGFPCQDISQCGNRLGLEGARSGLITQVFRLCKAFKPLLVMLENVATLRIRGLQWIVEQFSELGYNCRWITVEARAAGAPHRRKRIFILAVRRGKERILEQIDYEIEDFDLQSWAIEPNVARTTEQADKNGLKALGNAIVPAQARYAFRILGQDLLTQTPLPLRKKDLPACGCYQDDIYYICQVETPPEIPAGPKPWPATLQRFKTTHPLPTATASDAIIRKPTNTILSRAFRPGVNKSVTLNRWVALFPTRDTPLPELDDDGALVDIDDFPGGAILNVEWVTWLMGFPPTWLTD